MNEKKWLEATLLTMDKFSDPQPVIRQGNRVLLSRGDLATVTGKAKSMKTFLNSAICAGVLEDEFLTFSSSIKSARVLFIDSEQSRSHAQIVQHRIYKLCGYDIAKPTDRLVYLVLREYDCKTRLEYTIAAVEDLKPDLVIIDGIRDLVLDFNNLEESGKVVGELMRLSSTCNCGILTVLHQNKGDANARGHLGSELSNKSETIIQVVNDKGIATVSPVYSRNREIEDFSFRINKDGLPELCGTPKAEKKNGELFELIRKAMSDSAWLDRKTLLEKIITESGKSEKTAKRRITEAVDSGWIKINEQGLYILVKEKNGKENEAELLF